MKHFIFLMLAVLFVGCSTHKQIQKKCSCEGEYISPYAVESPLNLHTLGSKKVDGSILMDCMNRIHYFDFQDAAEITRIVVELDSLNFIFFNSSDLKVDEQGAIYYIQPNEVQLENLKKFKISSVLVYRKDNRAYEYTPNNRNYFRFVVNL